MKKNLFIAAMSLLVLAGCSSNEDEIDNIIANNDNAITFDTYVGKVTKGSVTGDAEIKKENAGFYVFASYTGTDEWEAVKTSAKPNFMYNQNVTYNTNKWEYSPVKYWPSNENENITFFAYAPQTGVTPSLATASGTPKLTFKVENEIAKQVDLVADMLTDKKNTSSDVAFELQHILSQIKLQASLAAQYQDATITIKSFSINFAEKKIKDQGIYTFSTDNTPATIWTAPSTPTYHSGSITSGNISLVLDNTSTLTAQSLLNPMFLIPQEYALGDIKATITYDVTSGSDTNMSTIENIKEVSLPIVTGGWLPNKQYIYNISISLTAVTISAQVGSWGDEVLPQ